MNGYFYIPENMLSTWFKIVDSIKEKRDKIESTR